MARETPTLANEISSQSQACLKHALSKYNKTAVCKGQTLDDLLLALICLHYLSPSVSVLRQRVSIRLRTTTTLHP